jgi:hypothetical protein
VGLLLGLIAIVVLSVLLIKESSWFKKKPVPPVSKPTPTVEPPQVLPTP